MHWSLVIVPLGASMTVLLDLSSRAIAHRSLSATVLTLLLLAPAPASWAHVGHGDEFHSGSQAQSPGAVNVDATTMKRLGLTVQPVTRQRLSLGVKTTGQIESLPNQQVVVTMPVKGTVTRVLVKPGDTVQAGQPVAIMSSPELADLRTTALDRRSAAIAAVQHAQADLRLAQQNLTQQKRIVATAIQQARTTVNVAQERYDKDRELLERGAIPRRQFLESESNLATAKTALAQAESGLPVSEAHAQLQRAESAVAEARSQVTLSDQTYQTRLSQLGARPNADGTLTVTAPIAGIVAEQVITPGESGEDAGKPILTVINSRQVQVSGNIFEKDLPQVRVGQAVRVGVTGQPHQRFTGEIRVVGAVVQGDSRVVPIKATLDNAAGVLKPGMFVTVEVLTDRTPTAVLAVPQSAIVETNDRQSIVFVQNGNAFEPVEVTLGRESGDWVEVTNGVFDGDRVVTQQAQQLYAQSLRRKPAEDAAHDHPETAAATLSTAVTMPWWLLLPVGGAIAAGTFWAGTQWATRRTRSALVAVHTGGRSEYSPTPPNFAPARIAAPSLAEVGVTSDPDSQPPSPPQSLDRFESANHSNQS